MTSQSTPPRLGRAPLPLPPRSDERQVGGETGLKPSDILDARYQIEERIGEGGVGIVYRAIQLKLQRRVAVKLLQQDVAIELEQRPRFEREALTLSALSHPNIVSVQDYGVFRGKPFLVMELLEGRTLREILDKDGPVAPERAIATIKQVLHALIYAHSLGIVHRDLKPANIVLQTLPSHEHVKVLDFGMVKLLPGSQLDRGVELSRVGFAFGTPCYMSPEHATGGAVDVRTDVYSTGILLFELLTAKKPFDGELQDVLRQHLQDPVPKLWDKLERLRGQTALQAIVERAMAKIKGERYQSALELLTALEGFEKGSALARAPLGAEGSRVPRRVFERAGARVDGMVRGLSLGFRGLGPALSRLFRGFRPALSGLLRRVRSREGSLIGKLRLLGQRLSTGLKTRWHARLAQLRASALALRRRANKGKVKAALPPPLEGAESAILDAAARGAQVVAATQERPVKRRPESSPAPVRPAARPESNPAPVRPAARPESNPAPVRPAARPESSPAPFRSGPPGMPEGSESSPPPVRSGPPVGPAVGPDSRPPRKKKKKRR